MSHIIQISEDEKTYTLNGISYHIAYPILLALENEKNNAILNAPRHTTKRLSYDSDYDGDDYFDQFLKRLATNDDEIGSRHPDYSFLSESVKENNSLYVSEASDELSEEEGHEDKGDEDDKENQYQEPSYAKIEYAIQHGNISFREKMFNTEHICGNN